MPTAAHGWGMPFHTPKATTDPGASLRSNLRCDSFTGTLAKDAKESRSRLSALHLCI